MVYNSMAVPIALLKNVTLSFNSMADLSAFKKECACGDFYVDRDSLTLIGSFTTEQLKIATGKYLALYYTNNDGD